MIPLKEERKPAERHRKTSSRESDFSLPAESASAFFMKVLILLGVMFLCLQMRVSSSESRNLLAERITTPIVRAEDLSVDAFGVPRIWVHLTLATQYDQKLMEHLANHYISVLGVDPAQILVELHHMDIQSASVVAATRRRLQKKFSLRNFQTWYGNYTSDRKWLVRHRHRQMVNVSSCDWVVVADSDEFPAVPGNNLAEFLSFVGSLGYDSVFGLFNDRVAVDGSLPNITEFPDISQQFPLSCRVTKNIAQGTRQKVVAFRGYHHENRAAHGLMDPANIQQIPNSKRYYQHCGYPVTLRIDHYKWHHPVLLKLQRRYDVYSKMKGNRQKESARVLDHVKENLGRLGIDRLHCTDRPPTVFYEDIYKEGVACGKKPKVQCYN